MSRPNRRRFLEAASATAGAFLAPGLSASLAQESPAPLPKSAGGLHFVDIDPGTFEMGSNALGLADEMPVREVTISRGFQMSVLPVTQRAYTSLIGSEPPPSAFDDDPQLPVEQVTWFDAARFCNALSQKVGVEPCYQINGDGVRWVSEQGYRLPTEVEWEYACRAGSNAEFCCGDDRNEVGQYAWFGTEAKGRTHPTGRKKPNAWGLHDVHGNVSEWCWDWYFERAYATLGNKNPGGVSRGTFRIHRGGSYLPEVLGVRSALRGRATPDTRARTIGFRVARSDYSRTL